MNTMVRHQWFVSLCLRAGLVALLLLAAGSPAALAGAEKPQPQPLWEAFPLNPTGKRLGSVSEPSARALPEATTAVETSPQASRPSIAVLALLAGAALLALALVGFASVRRLSVRSHHASPTVTGWQEISWSNPSDSGRELQRSRPVQSSADLGVDRHAAAPHPDVPASTYRLRRLDRRPLRRYRVAPGGRRVQPSRLFAGGFVDLIRRMREAVWNDRTAPVVVGTAVGIFAAFLLVYWIG